jgi:hypothetical protein
MHSSIPLESAGCGVVDGQRHIEAPADIGDLLDGEDMELGIGQRLGTTDIDRLAQAP